MEEIIVHQIGKDALYKTWHASKEHLLMYVHSAAGSIVTAERMYPLKQGTLVFLAAGTYHYTMPDDPQQYDRSKLIISPENFDKICALVQGNDILTFFSGKAVVYGEIGAQDRETVERIFAQMRTCKNTDEEALMLLSCCMQLLVFLHKYITESTVSAMGFMENAIRYVNENIASDLTVDTICAQVNMSKYYFCRKFKAHIGITVMEYILKTRLTLAKNELKKTGLSISQISEKFGFSSMSYFCRVFKEDCGMTPLQYRKNNADGLS